MRECALEERAVVYEKVYGRNVDSLPERRICTMFSRRQWRTQSIVPLTVVYTQADKAQIAIV